MKYLMLFFSLSFSLQAAQFKCTVDMDDVINFALHPLEKKKQTENYQNFWLKMHLVAKCMYSADLEEALKKYGVGKHGVFYGIVKQCTDRYNLDFDCIHYETLYLARYIDELKCISQLGEFVDVNWGNDGISYFYKPSGKSAEGSMEIKGTSAFYSQYNKSQCKGRFSDSCRFPESLPSQCLKAENLDNN